MVYNREKKNQNKITKVSCGLVHLKVLFVFHFIPKAYQFACSSLAFLPSCAYYMNFLLGEKYFFPGDIHNILYSHRWKFSFHFKSVNLRQKPKPFSFRQCIYFSKIVKISIRLLYLRYQEQNDYSCNMNK